MVLRIKERVLINVRQNKKKKKKEKNSLENEQDRDSIMENQRERETLLRTQKLKWQKRVRKRVNRVEKRRPPTLHTQHGKSTHY